MNNIYIIDDDENLRNLIEKCLNEDGYCCQGFDSAEKFLLTVESEPVGCLIIDIEMGGMSGLDLQRKLNDRGWTVPRIFVSGVAEVGHAIDALQNGAFFMLQKPFKTDELQDAVRDAMIHMHQLQIEQTSYDSMKTKVASLSETELQVLELLLAGQLNKVIAARLDIGLRSVVRFRRNILKKFDTETIPQLVRELFESSILPISNNGERLNGILKLFK